MSRKNVAESFFLEFSHLDTDCFQIYLNKLSEQYPEQLNIIQLDNGSFHTTKALQVPPNIIFLFQPPHSPELNPIERLWQYIKNHDLLGDLRQFRTAAIAYKNGVK
ncbi:transposase [Brasilonema sennae]|uniref:transposase n=1 Tax=Brasilonema sennae TaxID=1397703 RepID=UPI0015C5427B|nr:transposase [Brasilonema sennae]